MYAKQFWILTDIVEKRHWTDKQKDVAVEILNEMPPEQQETILLNLLRK